MNVELSTSIENWRCADSQAIGLGRHDPQSRIWNWRMYARP
jgi:hypothetical protein